MKKTLFGIILLCSLSLAFAETAATNPATTSRQESSREYTALGVLLESPTLSRSDNSTPIVSKTEFDSLRTQEGRMLATSNIDAIKVGNVGNNDLIYILVVVLLVVLIIAVI